MFLFCHLNTEKGKEKEMIAQSSRAKWKMRKMFEQET